MAFLNEQGLATLWNKIDDKFARSSEVEEMVDNVEAKIPTVPTSLKNPNSLTVKGNGTQSFTYDGSSSKTLNIKPGTNVSVTSDTSGNITISSTDTNTTYSAGNGITQSGTTFSHADTSSATNLTANGRKYVTGLTFDTYGHVTGYTTGTETVSDTNTTYTFATGDSNGQIAVTPSGGTKQNISVKGLGSAAYTASTDYAPSSLTNTVNGVSSIADLANTKANELINGAMAANKATNVVINNGAGVIQFITYNSTTSLPAVTNGAILIAYDA